mgnify:CR=1 FL=1
MSLDKIQEIFVNSGVEINDALATGKLTNVKVNVHVCVVPVVDDVVAIG